MKHVVNYNDGNDIVHNTHVAGAIYAGTGSRVDIYGAAIFEGNRAWRDGGERR